MMSEPAAVHMRGITKRFSGITANDSVELLVRRGEIHALLGENGAGKSTLMNVLFGLYEPDAGSIEIHGTETAIASPAAATKLGIGMVHQHFHLVQPFTVLENIMLGVEHCGLFGTVNTGRARAEVRRLCEDAHFEIDLDARIKDIPVSAQQRVEILKMLYRKADILIFDEPTAVLTPQEIDDLLLTMKGLAKRGKSIIFITHKLGEILSAADRCTVLRLGKNTGTLEVKDATKETLSELMVGRAINFAVNGPENFSENLPDNSAEHSSADKTPAAEKDGTKPPEKPAQKHEATPVLELRDIRVTERGGITKLNRCTLTVHAGEILGLAGIEGNGQAELAEIITGMRLPAGGSLHLLGRDITRESVRGRIARGISCIPEDRLKYGLIPSFELKDTLILSDYYREPFSRRGLLRQPSIVSHADALIAEFDIRCGNGARSVSASLSGGNQQKAIIAREVFRKPSLLLAVQPTRGLDVGAIEYVHTRIIAEKKRGAAVLLISYDLDEIFALTDAVAVISRGVVTERIATKKANRRDIGLAMAGVQAAA